MYQLVLIRHGLSEWNKKKLFTGWTDVDLHPEGVEEAKKAGQLMKEAGLSFDMAYTSYLKRAIKTLHLSLEEMNELWIPIEKSWKLNERHYGALQGFSKIKKAEEVGEEQVHIWRRSFDTPPPALELSDERHPSHDPRYAGLDPADLPAAECLKDTLERVLPYWESEIVPNIKAGKKIIISAHGNSLRALVKYIDDISDEDIPGLSIPTGKPQVYELDENMKSIKSYYLE
jgi:2,3-bisphosphoglycerate-dependent phosphoglycerate mutase